MCVNDQPAEQQAASQDAELQIAVAQEWLGMLLEIFFFLLVLRIVSLKWENETPELCVLTDGDPCERKE